MTRIFPGRLVEVTVWQMDGWIDWWMVGWQDVKVIF